MSVIRRSSLYSSLVMDCTTSSGTWRRSTDGPVLTTVGSTSLDMAPTSSLPGSDPSGGAGCRPETQLSVCAQSMGNLQAEPTERDPRRVYQVLISVGVMLNPYICAQGIKMTGSSLHVVQPVRQSSGRRFCKAHPRIANVHDIPNRQRRACLG